MPRRSAAKRAIDRKIEEGTPPKRVDFGLETS